MSRQVYLYNVLSSKEPRHQDVNLSQSRVIGSDRVAHVLKLIGQGLEAKNEVDDS